MAFERMTPLASHAETRDVADSKRPTTPRKPRVKDEVPASDMDRRIPPPRDRRHPWASPSRSLAGSDVDDDTSIEAPGQRYDGLQAPDTPKKWPRSRLADGAASSVDLVRRHGICNALGTNKVEANECA
jgi:hypothetical protein